MTIHFAKPLHKQFLFLKEPKVTLKREGPACPACAAGNPLTVTHEIPARQEPDGTYVLMPHGGQGVTGLLRAKCTGKDCRVCQILRGDQPEISFTHRDLQLERERRIRGA